MLEALPASPVPRHAGRGVAAVPGPARLPSPPPSPRTRKHRTAAPRAPSPPAAARIAFQPRDLRLLLTPPLSPAEPPSQPADWPRHPPPPRGTPLPRSAPPRPASPLNAHAAHLRTMRAALSGELPRVLPSRNPHLARLVPRRTAPPPPREDSFEDDSVAVWWVTPVAAAPGAEDADPPDLRRWLAGKRTFDPRLRRRREPGISPLRLELLPDPASPPPPPAPLRRRKLPSLGSMPALVVPLAPAPLRPRMRTPSLPSLLIRLPSPPADALVAVLPADDSDSDQELPRSPSPPQDELLAAPEPGRRHARRHSDSIVRRLEEEERMATAADGGEVSAVDEHFRRSWWA